MISKNFLCFNPQREMMFPSCYTGKLARVQCLGEPPRLINRTIASVPRKVMPHCPENPATGEQCFSEKRLHERLWDSGAGTSL